MTLKAYHQSIGGRWAGAPSHETLTVDNPAVAEAWWKITPRTRSLALLRVWTTSPTPTPTS